MIVVILAVLLGSIEAPAQTQLLVSHLDAQFQWDLQPYTEENAPESHVLTCGGVSVIAPMPATSIPVKDVVPGPGQYTCTLYAQNGGGRQVEPDVPFPIFESGYTPGQPFQLVVNESAAPPPPPPTLTYFGSQSHDADDNTGGVQFSAYNATWTAPGSGSILLTELAAYVRALSGVVKIRVGLYDTGGTLVAESDEIDVPNTTYAWVGGVSPAQLRPAGGAFGDPITITGGADYRLAFAEVNGGDCGVGYATGGVTGDVTYSFANYSAGLPATIPNGTSWLGLWNIRAGVLVP